MNPSDRELVERLRSNWAEKDAHTVLARAADTIEELTQHVFNSVATIDRLSKDNERLREALNALVVDCESYPAWQRPVHAVEVARTALELYKVG